MTVDPFSGFNLSVSLCPAVIKPLSSLTEKLIFYFGVLIFLLLGIMSLYFWKERQAYDTAHYLLELIIRKWFFIAHNRPAGIVSQVLPLLGIYLGVPLNWLLKLYSFGDILFYFLVFFTLTRIAGNYAAGLTMLVSYMLFTAYSFYCPVTELMQGMVLLPLLWVVFDSAFRLKYPVVFLLMAFIIFSHPLLFIPTGIMIAWRWFQPGHEKRETLILLGACILISTLKLLLLDQYDYQKTYYPVVFNDYSNLRNLKDGTYILSFLRLLIISFPVAGCMFLVAMLLMASKREFLKIIFLVFTVAGFVIILVATHRFTAVTNYSERMLLPLAFILALPFSTELLKVRSNLMKHAILSVLLVFLVYRTHSVGVLSADYTLRIQMMENLIDVSHKSGHQKTIADEDFLELVPTAGSGWCYSIETMLFSALQGPEKTVSVAMQHDHIERIQKAGILLQPDQWIKWMEFILQDDTLPARYFSFSPQLYVPLRNEGKTDSLALSSVKINVDGPLQFSNKGAAILTVRFTGIGTSSVPANAGRICLQANSGRYFFPLITDLYEDAKQQICLPAGINPGEIDNWKWSLVVNEKSPAQ